MKFKQSLMSIAGGLATVFGLTNESFAQTAENQMLTSCKGRDVAFVRLISPSSENQKRVNEIVLRSENSIISRSTMKENMEVTGGNYYETNGTKSYEFILPQLSNDLKADSAAENFMLEARKFCRANYDGKQSEILSQQKNQDLQDLVKGIKKIFP